MVAIKNMDAATWRAIRAEAIRQEVNVAEMIKLLWEHYAKEQR